MQIPKKKMLSWAVVCCAGIFFIPEKCALRAGFVCQLLLKVMKVDLQGWEDPTDKTTY